MTGVRPTPRGITVCEAIAPDVENPRRLTLHRVVHSIQPKRGCSYPVRHGRLCVFAQVTEGRGTGTMAVVVRRADTEQVIYRTADVQVVLPQNDPLRVFGASFTTAEMTFPTAGLYWFELWYDDSVLMQTPVVLRP
jgi:hypothetical protein